MASRNASYLLFGSVTAGLALYIVWKRQKASDATKSDAAIPSSALQYRPEEEARVSQLKVGESAEALYKYGRKWYAVKVRTVNDDGTYALDYEDGDFWDQVPPDRIRDPVTKVLLSPPPQEVDPESARAKAASSSISRSTNATELKHAVIPEAFDPAYLNELFPRIKAVFKPQAVKYSNTNPDIAASDGGAHGEKVDWKVSAYMEVDNNTPGAAQRGVACDPDLLEVMAPLLEQCNRQFTAWYESLHGTGSVPRLKRLQSFVTRYRPFPNENALLRHVDGAHVDGSVILALPTDSPFAGGGVTVWEPTPALQLPPSKQPQTPAQNQPRNSSAAAPTGVNSHSGADLPAASAPLPPGCASVSACNGRPELAYLYPMSPGSLCLLDNCVWHQGNPITAGERWSLVIFYAVKPVDSSRLLKIVKKAADEKRGRQQ